MPDVNKVLFLAINAGPEPPAVVLEMARLLAVWAVPAAILLFALLWVRIPDARRAALISATAIMILGLVINQVISALYVHPRPFMIGLGHQYLAHRPNNSFPSDHAVFLWCLAFSLFVLGTLRGWAVLLTALGLGVAWARVYLGVHFPFDMAGAFLVALVLSPLASMIELSVLRLVLPRAVALYEAVLDATHLPPKLFPRAPRAAPFADGGPPAGGGPLAGRERPPRRV